MRIDRGRPRKMLVAILTVGVLVGSGPAAYAAGWAVRVRGAHDRAQITWGNINNTNQATRRLPWRRKVAAPGSFNVVSVLAQRQSGGSGRILCQVLHNGRVVARGRGSGPYAICQASKATS